MDADEIDYHLMETAREDRRVDWEESEPDLVEAVEHLDQPIIEIVWDAAWKAALEAREALDA